MISTINSLIRRYVGLLVAGGVAIAAVILLATALFTTASAIASELPEISVYRDPSCSCCEGWMEHLTVQGFQPENIPTSDVDSLKQDYGVPDDLTSCHTAVIDGYVIEGHVPAEDIKRLLIEQPDFVGLTVPGMPVGTPGMESGEEQEAFTVFSFDAQGNTEVFNQYSF